MLALDKAGHVLLLPHVPVCALTCWWQHEASSGVRCYCTLCMFYLSVGCSLPAGGWMEVLQPIIATKPKLTLWYTHMCKAGYMWVDKYNHDKSCYITSTNCCYVWIKIVFIDTCHARFKWIWILIMCNMICDSIFITLWYNRYLKLECHCKWWHPIG